MNDFCKFACFVRAVQEAGTVIELSGRKLRHDVKFHFKSLMKHSRLFDKFLRQELPAESAIAEDEINSSIINMVWILYDMSAEDRGRFVDYINKFDYDGKSESGNETLLEEL